MDSRFSLLLGCTLLLLLPAAHAGELTAGYAEELLATQPGSSKVFTAAGARQVVWRETRARRWTMVVNGVAGKEYANVGLPVFSPDGSRMAYTAQRDPGASGGVGSLVVHDGREGPAFRQVALLQFTTDGKHVGYVAADAGGFRPFLDERALEPAGSAAAIAGLWLNADGSRWAYWRDDGIVVDGRLRPQHKSRSAGGRVDSVPQFSPDGRRLAYRVAQGVKTIVVVDDQESQPYDSAADPTFSPDGRHVAYVAVRDRRVYAVIDGIEGPPQFRILGTAIAFSPDGGRFAYFGLPQNVPYYWLPKGTDPRRVSGLFLLGGKLDDVSEALKGLPMDTLSARLENVVGPVWSVDGVHWAYARPEAPGTVVVADGKVSDAHEAVTGLAIDREGRPIFGARQAKLWTVMRGGQTMGQAMDELLGTVLSPDGRQAAWAGRRGNKQFVATAAGEGKAYDLVFASAMAFSADGTALHYVARDGDRLLRVTEPVGAAGAN